MNEDKNNFSEPLSNLRELINKMNEHINKLCEPINNSDVYIDNPSGYINNSNKHMNKMSGHINNSNKHINNVPLQSIHSSLHNPAEQYCGILGSVSPCWQQRHKSTDKKQTLTNVFAYVWYDFVLAFFMLV